MRLSLSILSLLVALVALTSCQGDSERVDRLHSEILDLKDDITDLKRKLGDEDLAAEPSDIEERFEGLETQLADALQRYDDNGGLAYLRQNADGHATMKTDHGTFLIRLNDIELNVGGRGYIAHLEIGNLTALTIQEVVLKGDHGSGVPSLAPGQEYNAYQKEIAAWQKTLTPFEVRVTKPLNPQVWTPISIGIDATSRDDLDLMRFTMEIKNAHLKSVEEKNFDEQKNYSHIRIDSSGASILKTDYGIFFVVVNKATPSGDGTKLDLQIGSGNGFTVDKCYLTGTYGKAQPRQTTTETQEQYLGRLRGWMESWQTFESPVIGKLAPNRWSNATILVPGRINDVKFLRAQLKIQNVTLPHK